MRRGVVGLVLFALLASGCSDDSGDASVPTTQPTTTTTFGGTTTTDAPDATTATTDAPDLKPTGGTVRVRNRGLQGTLNTFLQLDLVDPAQMLKPLVAGGVWRLDGDRGELVADLITELPTQANGGLVLNDDGTLSVRYEIHPDAVWSDGEPITGDDFLFTYETALATTGRIFEGDLPDDAGPEVFFTDCGVEIPVGFWPGFAYDAIVPGSPSADQKSFEYVLEDAGAYSFLLFDVVLPRHAMEGTDFFTDWNDRLWPSAGPFVLESWDVETATGTFVRNDRYWRKDPDTGQQLPLLDRVIVDSFTDEIAARIPDSVEFDDDGDPATAPVAVDSLKRYAGVATTCVRPAAALDLEASGADELTAGAFGQVSDAAWIDLFKEGLVVDYSVDDVRPIEGVDLTVIPSDSFEFISVNFSDARLRANPDSLIEHLDFRRALAHAIDRDRVANEAFAVPAQRLDSLLDIFSPTLAATGWDRYEYDPERARELLGALCTRLGRDCQADPPRLVITRSSEWAHRSATVESLTEMLGEVGIEVEVVNQTIGAMISYEECSGWETSVFGIPGGPDFRGYIDFYALWSPSRGFFSWGIYADADDEPPFDDPETEDCDESVEEMTSVRDEFSDRFDEVFEEAAALPSLDDAVRLVRELDDILADQVVLIPLYAWPAAYAARDDIVGGYGYNFSDGDYEPVWNIDRWYLIQPQPGT